MAKKLTLKTVFVGLVISSALIFCFGFTTWDLSDPESKDAKKGELYLRKVDPFHPACMPCEDIFYLRSGDNRKNFREYPLYLQSGYYKIDLFGPEGTEISFFGSENFQTSMGYLKVIKRDGERASVYNIEDLKPETWVEIPAHPGVTGAYSVYFSPYPSFEENIASISWNLENSEQ
jgi:hypothetical protein